MSFFFFERYQTKLRNFIRYAPLTLNAISTRLAQIHTCMSIYQQGVSKSVCVCVCVCVLVFGFVAVCYSDCIFSKPPVYVFVLQFYSKSRQRRQHIGQARGAKHEHRSCRPVPKPVLRPVPGSTSQQLRAAIAPWHFNIYPTYEWTKCRRFVAKNWMRIKAQLL